MIQLYYINRHHLVPFDPNQIFSCLDTCSTTTSIDQLVSNLDFDVSQSSALSTFKDFLLNKLI